MKEKSDYCNLILEEIDNLLCLYASFELLRHNCYIIPMRDKINIVKEINDKKDLISMLKNTSNYDRLPKLEKMIIHSKEIEFKRNNEKIIRKFEIIRKEVKRYNEKSK